MQVKKMCIRDSDRLLKGSSLSKFFHVCSNCRKKIFLDDLNQSTCLDMKCLYIVLKLDLITGMKLCMCKDMMVDEKLFILFINEMRQCIRSGYQVVKPTSVSYTHLDVYKRQTGSSSQRSSCQSYF